LPDRTDRALRGVACELVAGHDGRHIAFVVASDGGDRWWWVRWTARAREVVPLDVCEAVGHPFLDDCLLPPGHPGPHSFELRARPPRPARRRDPRGALAGGMHTDVARLGHQDEA